MPHFFFSVDHKPHFTVTRPARGTRLEESTGELKHLEGCEAWIIRQAVYQPLVLFRENLSCVTLAAQKEGFVARCTSEVPPSYFKCLSLFLPSPSQRLGPDLSLAARSFSPQTLSNAIQFVLVQLSKFNLG
jgi:hypothetical protein